MNKIMTREEYKTLPSEKVAFYRAARKDLREARKRAGIARLPAKMAARNAHVRIAFAEREARVQAMLARSNAAIEKRHYSKSYFDIYTMWEWEGLYLWIPKETNA